MTIAVNIRAPRRFPARREIRKRGRLTALFGPSGSGKSSVINFIAGLIAASDGKVTIDGRVLFD